MHWRRLIDMALLLKNGGAIFTSKEEFASAMNAKINKRRCDMYMTTLHIKSARQSADA